MNAEPFPENVGRLRTLLESRNLVPNKRFGQNFLIEPKILDTVVRLAELSPADCVLEVGTGTGALTRRLCDGAGQVVSVEIDQGLFHLARDFHGDRANLRLIHGDVLASKSSLNPEICEKLDLAATDDAITTLKVVANLPYNISTPFLNALVHRYGPPSVMVLMVQWELAQNLMAKPGSDAYSPLSILLQLLCEISVDRRLPKEVFWPRPKVESAIAVIRSLERDLDSVLRAHPLMTYLFRERRKAIAGQLRRLPDTLGGPLEAEQVAMILDRLGIPGDERAENLPPERFLELHRGLSDLLD